MRKSTEGSRFPQSACLFKFCLRALESQRGTRVHDQELGNILEYNPSDTSHWKRGKKAVRSIFALDRLALTLDVHVELIEDIVDGSIGLDEAWFEYEEAREIRRINSSLSKELKLERSHRLKAIEAAAEKILREASIQSTPVFIPELASAFPEIQISPADVAEKLARSSRGKPGTFLIRYRKGDMNPHVRAALAREIARIILISSRAKYGLPERIDNLEAIEIVELSNALLVPRAAFEAETIRLQSRADLIRSLAEVFWVPKFMIRARLKEMIINNMSDSSLREEPLTVRPFAETTPVSTPVIPN